MNWLLPDPGDGSVDNTGWLPALAALCAIPPLLGAIIAAAILIGGA